MLIVSVFELPFGILQVTHDEHSIFNAAFNTTQNSSLNRIARNDTPSKLTLLIAKELKQYIQDPAHVFNLPLLPEGTDYQRTVWNVLTHIPSGQTVTYGELANQLSSSPRAIGQACKNNPIPLFIPCHRVISKRGLGGFMGKQDKGLNKLDWTKLPIDHPIPEEFLTLQHKISLLQLEKQRKHTHNQMEC